MSEFEEWVNGKPLELGIDKYPSDDPEAPWPGQYKDYMTQNALEAWNAALEAAAEKCEEISAKWNHQTTEDCADEIRSMKHGQD